MALLNTRLPVRFSREQRKLIARAAKLAKVSQAAVVRDGAILWAKRIEKEYKS